MSHRTKNKKFLCVVAGCCGKDGDGVRLIAFPDTYTKKWCENLRIDENSVTICSRICARHFEDDCFGVNRIKSGAMPTLKLGHNEKPLHLSNLSAGSMTKTKLRCSVYGCTSTNFDTKLFRFPLLRHRRTKWMEICRVPQEDRQYKHFVCRKHFTDETIGKGRVRANAIPTLYLDDTAGPTNMNKAGSSSTKILGAQTNIDKNLNKVLAETSVNSQNQRIEDDIVYISYDEDEKKFIGNAGHLNRITNDKETPKNVIIKTITKDRSKSNKVIILRNEVIEPVNLIKLIEAQLIERMATNANQLSACRKYSDSSENKTISNNAMSTNCTSSTSDISFPYSIQTTDAYAIQQTDLLKEKMAERKQQCKEMQNQSKNFPALSAKSKPVTPLKPTAATISIDNKNVAPLKATATTIAPTKPIVENEKIVDIVKISNIYSPEVFPRFDGIASEEPSNANIKNVTKPPSRTNSSITKRKETENLNNHLLTHSNVKPYKCSYCRRRYKKRTIYERHVRLHMEAIKPCGCTVCNKSFATQNELKLHQICHHSVVKLPSQCPHCTYVTPKTMDFHLHISKQHHEDALACEKCATLLSELDDKFTQDVSSSRLLKGTQRTTFKCSNYEELELHHIIDPEQTKLSYQCPHCICVSPNTRALHLHIDELHHKDTMHCQLCAKKLPGYKMQVIPNNQEICFPYNNCGKSNEFVGNAETNKSVATIDDLGIIEPAAIIDSMAIMGKEIVPSKENLTTYVNIATYEGMRINESATTTVEYAGDREPMDTNQYLVTTDLAPPAMDGVDEAYLDFNKNDCNNFSPYIYNENEYKQQFVDTAEDIIQF